MALIKREILTYYYMYSNKRRMASKAERLYCSKTWVQPALEGKL